MHASRSEPPFLVSPSGFHSLIMSLRRETLIVLRNEMKGHRATRIRSLDRVIGLGDAMRRDTHFQSLTFADCLETYDYFS